ncbi:MAG: hypothetical protein JO078_05280 [Candidatus Eremiobacteraeota bacterium]|nr:hypothetical protein [Candidatus Eremiobacteraeota bacterium]MBV9056066.1 hypothetical protein [Candidatus Eremiobacteraeota bacterium]MBV9699520.1 hypothetical protein [Candidatus Eremiobacteraeota bacterium]
MAERFPGRFVSAVALFCSVALLALAPPPTPSATPPPLPPPGPAAPVGQTPLVVVYPFDVQTGADPRLGVAIAEILGQEMTAAGGISVPPIPKGVKRADFLDFARGAKADFYISGYVTPVGDSAAVVEQVVSTDSGVILFSQTAQVSSVADVASQSLLARSQILAFLGRGAQQMQAQTSSTPAPSATNGAKVPLSGIASIVDSVFHHRGNGRGATPAPGAKPDRGVIVAPVAASGSAVASDLASATHELYFALNRYFTTQMTSVSSADIAHAADQICGNNRDNTIASGTLTEAPARHGHLDITFNLTVYTCFGAPLEHETGKSSSVKAAIDSAVSAYSAAHPDNS